jgi:hypothetical protein
MRGVSTAQASDVPGNSPVNDSLEIGFTRRQRSRTRWRRGWFFHHFSRQRLRFCLVPPLVCGRHASRHTPGVVPQLARIPQ